MQLLGGRSVIAPTVAEVELSWRAADCRPYGCGGSLRVRGWNRLVGGVMTPPYGVVGWTGGWPMGVPTGAEGEMEGG